MVFRAYHCVCLFPAFILSEAFDYETRVTEDLSQKTFKLELLGNTLLGAPDFLASCYMDLHSIATGPPKLSLPLSDVSFH